MTSATPKIHPEIEDIFCRCVVRIPARGTGFFIAPGYVLTCAHLFEDRARRAQVLWGTRNWEADVHYLETDKSLDHVDLALLEMVPIDGQVEHPCVLMSDDLSRGDHLFVFGHPQSEFEVNGDCLNFHYGGPSRDKHGIDYIRTPGDRAER